MVSAWRNFKNIFPRPLFIIIFRLEMLKFHPYSILTEDTMVGFVIFCVLKRVQQVIVHFEQIHTALFRVQKTACASYHCCCCLDSRQCRKVKKREFNQSFQPGKCFHQLCFAPSSFLSLLLPCQVQDGQEKTKNKVLPKLYASLTVIAIHATVCCIIFQVVLTIIVD